MTVQQAIDLIMAFNPQATVGKTVDPNGSHANQLANLNFELCAGETEGYLFRAVGANGGLWHIGIDGNNVISFGQK